MPAQSVVIEFLQPTQPSFTDLNGDRLRIVEAGDQVVASTTFRNLHEYEISFIGILEVRDLSGITMFLAWQKTEVEPYGNKTFSVSWLVPESKVYQLRTFAFSDLETYEVLSYVESFETAMPEP